jgi:hypothetical protein
MVRRREAPGWLSGQCATGMCIVAVATVTLIAI